MTALLTPAQLRRTVQTDLDDADLQSLIDEEEAELVRRCGPHGDGVTAVSETIPGGASSLFLRRRAVSIASISEQRSLTSSGVTLTSGQYLLWGDAGSITRVGAGAWGALVTVSYVPVDDQALRRQVLTELVRLRLSQTALQSESVAGEYSYTAPPNWEATRSRQYRRLTLMNV